MSTKVDTSLVMQLRIRITLWDAIKIRVAGKNGGWLMQEIYKEAKKEVEGNHRESLYKAEDMN